jgi:serpin B
MKTIHYLILTAILLNAAAMGLDQDPNEISVQPVVKGNTEFALNLYAQLKERDGNLFFSPYSISTALAMTYAGARGDTAEQMGFVLNYPMHPNVLNPAYGALISELNDPNRADHYQLSIANALWGQKDYTFLDAFIQLNKDYYHAGLENVDFVSETEHTRRQINQWVEDKTNDKIKDLIPQGALDAMTRLVLTNAIYFKGDWACQFDEAATEDADFFVSPDKTVKAPLMFQKEKFNYGENEMLQVLQLPYNGDELTMLVLLPKARDGLAALENELTAETLAEWQKQLRNRDIEVYLPKFKMTSQFSLSGILAKMGMPDAFDIGKADFSGMTGNNDLFISAVLHKAFVEVNEEGTEAAAATGIIMTTKSVEIAPPPVFRADHPFVFVIQDNKTESILFVGRVADPTEESK